MTEPAPTPGYLAWTVAVDRTDEDTWRCTLGQADIDDWCTAHGWDSNHVRSGSVTVWGYRDGHIEVTAQLYLPDANGKHHIDPETGDIAIRDVAARLARSLPEGIGTVIRS